MLAFDSRGPDRGSRRQRPVVLIVDADLAGRRSLQRVLDEGHEVIAVESRAAALRVVRARRVDVVFLDVVLPGRDGLGVLREIGAFDARIPVVMATAVRTVAMVVEAMRQGAFDYLTKPLDADVVRRVARQAIAPVAGGSDRNGRPFRFPRRTQRPIIVAGGDIGWRAALSLVLQPLGPVRLADATASGWADAELPAVSCALVTAEVVPPDLARTLRRLRRNGQTRPFVLLVHGGATRIGLELESLGIRSVRRAPGYVAEVVAAIGAELSHAERAHPRLSHYSSRAVEHLAGSYESNLTLRDVADVLRVSESHLAHVFRSDTGMPPKRFLARVRAAAAEHLLRTSGEKVAAVAERLGFCDGSHLLRTLHKHGARSARAVDMGRFSAESRHIVSHL